MADYMVLERWSGVVGGRPTRFAPATIICDAANDIAALRAVGCALVIYTAAHLGAARAAYLAAHDETDPNAPSMIGTLMGLGVSPNEREGVVTAAGAGDEVVTFPEIETPYKITYGVEDNGAGGATVVIKQSTITSTGFTLTVGGAAKFHWHVKTIP